MFYSRVFNAQTRELVGHLVDITPQGAMLISEAPLPTNTMFQLKMELSEDIADKPYLEFGAKSLWCQQDIDPHFYNTGFQLLDVPSQDVEIIQRIVEAYGFRDN